MICKTCHEEKEENDFYSDERRPTGRFAECILCCRARALRWRRSHLNRAREQSKKWNREHREQIARCQRANNAENREKIREKNKRIYRSHRNEYKQMVADWRKINPEKAKAHDLFKSALHFGKIVRPEICSRCGKSGKIHGHHEDYSKPLEVIWLCSVCHARMHKMKYPECGVHLVEE